MTILFIEVLTFGLIDERNHAFDVALGKSFTKHFRVFLVDGVGTWGKIGKCPHSKNNTAPRPGKYGKNNTLH